MLTADAIVLDNARGVLDVREPGVILVCDAGDRGGIGVEVTRRRCWRTCDEFRRGAVVAEVDHQDP